MVYIIDKVYAEAILSDVDRAITNVAMSYGCTVHILEEGRYTEAALRLPRVLIRPKYTTPGARMADEGQTGATLDDVRVRVLARDVTDPTDEIRSAPAYLADDRTIPLRAKVFREQARQMGLEPGDLGKEFLSWDNRVFKIIGASAFGPYPILGEDKCGLRYVFTVANVVRGLMKKSSPEPPAEVA